MTKIRLDIEQACRELLESAQHLDSDKRTLEFLRDQQKTAFANQHGRGVPPKLAKEFAEAARHVAEWAIRDA